MPSRFPFPDARYPSAEARGEQGWGRCGVAKRLVAVIHTDRRCEQRSANLASQGAMHLVRGAYGSYGSCTTYECAVAGAKTGPTTFFAK